MRLRVYLLILVLGAMLPGALLTGIVVWRAFATTRDTSEHRLLESARIDALALDREFARTISTLEALATSPALDRGDLAAFYQEGVRILPTQPGWFSVLVHSVDGHQLVNTSVTWGTPLTLTLEPESLRRLVQTREPVVGVLRSPDQAEPARRFPIRVPVVREGGLKYVLSAIVDVESLARVVPRQLPNSDEWTRSILDAEGTIAVRTRGDEDYIGMPATDAFRARLLSAPESLSSETTREGLPVYAATSRSAYGWTTAVVVPRTLLDAPLRASLTGLAGGATLLMLCGLVAVLVVTRRLSTDLAAATSAAEAVAEGHAFAQPRTHLAETLRLQNALTTAGTLLEKRARERDAEIQRADRARTEAEEANRTKDSFLAVLGHELRNPLAPALTALELMKARDPSAFRREREVLERQVAHMSRLVNDLLDVSRLARGKVNLDRRRFELRAAVDRAVDMATPLMSQHHHTLDVSVPATGLTIDGDVDRIVQVLCNLLTNAAKYTPPGGHVSLSASVSDDRVIVACEDSGPGIAPDLVPTLFEPFAQGPRALDRREGGLGLGLALARIFTELHDGRIHVEPRAAGQGSRFVVELPKAPSTSVSPSVEPERGHHPVVGRRILVVDDNIDACAMLEDALGRAGHTLTVANNGPDAMARAAEFRPEVAVLDIGLPGMDGYELARRLRALYPDLRLIALTGYGQSSDVEAATAAGFDAHCAKPVTTATLLTYIDSPRDAAAQ